VKRFGQRLDRGRRTHGAKWCFVPPSGDRMLNYRELREGYATEKEWAAWRKAHKDWILFKSQREAKRWIYLVDALRAGGVRALRRQVKMPLQVQRPDGLAETIGHYFADFVYEEHGLTEDPQVDIWTGVVEESKGYREDLYIWKKRHFEVQYGTKIREC